MVSATSAAPPASAKASPSGAPNAGADAIEPPSPVASFAPVKANKACKTATSEMAVYQQRSELAIAAAAKGFAGSWLTLLGSRQNAQVAFAAYDIDGRQVAAPRGVGLSMLPTRVFASGTGWTVTWFDDKGLAFARPRNEPLPAPNVEHLASVGGDVADDVALGKEPSGALVAVAPFGTDKTKLGLFVFAPLDEAAPATRAIGVTHHAKAPRRPAVAADAKGTLIAWHEDEDGRVLASRFDPTGKETESACEVAPASKDKRDRLVLVPVAGGAVAGWVEEGSIRTRALDDRGCASSPIHTIGSGKWLSLAPLATGAVAVWVGTDGKLLAARVAPTGAAGAEGIDAGDGTTGVKDPPSIAVGEARLGFAWSEVMSPVISSKRFQLRTIEIACLP